MKLWYKAFINKKEDYESIVQELIARVDVFEDAKEIYVPKDSGQTIYFHPRDAQEYCDVVKSKGYRLVEAEKPCLEKYCILVSKR